MEVELPLVADPDGVMESVGVLDAHVNSSLVHAALYLLAGDHASRAG